MHPGCSLLVKAAFLRVCLVSCKLLSCYCKRLRDMFSGEARSVSERASERGCESEKERGTSEGVRSPRKAISQTRLPTGAHLFPLQCSFS